MINYYQLQDLLLKYNSFVITTHVNPDADAIGSEMAMYYILKELNKDVRIVNYSGTPYNLFFMDPNNVIEKYLPDTHDEILLKAESIIAVDFNRSERVVKMKDAFTASPAAKICIDHHLDPEGFTIHYFADESQSSTGQIIYEFIKKTSIVKLNYNIAYNVYAAIMTDTGSFRFDRTNSHIHRIAAELLETGVDPTFIYDNIFDQSKFSKLQLLGRALNSVKLFGNSGGLSYMILTQKDFAETGAIESDTDGFVNFALSVENVRIGILFIELKEGFKISFRSKGNFPVNKLAGEFGGGGHNNAAGARIFNKNLYEYLPQVLTKAEEYFNKHKD